MRKLPFVSARLKDCSVCILILFVLEAAPGSASRSLETLPPLKLYQLTIPQVEEVMASLSRTHTTVAARIAA